MKYQHNAQNQQPTGNEGITTTQHIHNEDYIEDGINYSTPSETRTFYLHITDSLGVTRKIYVSEEVYDVYQRDRRREKKALELESRCYIPSTRGYKVCREDCSKCHRARNPRVSSLNAIEEGGHQFTSSYESPVEYAERMEIRDAFFNVVNEIEDTTTRAILILFYEQYTYEDIAKILGIAKSTVSKRFALVKLYLQERLNKFRKG